MSRFLLIPAHNRRALTLGCLASLRATGDLVRYGVIVIDDGSTDGTGEAINAEFPDVILVRGDGTLFWTGAIARGMREAAARGAGPLLWLNDDCRPRPGAVPALFAYLDQNPTALVGPRCLDAATGLVVPTGFIGRRIYSVAPDSTQAVAGLSGFCVGLAAAVAPRLGLPDAASFPHYYGDSAYTLQASRAGCPVVLLGHAAVDLVDHHGGPSNLAERLQRHEGLARTWAQVFAATNSPFRLRTLFAFQRLKYGPVAGTALASLRAGTWIARLIASKIG